MSALATTIPNGNGGAAALAVDDLENLLRAVDETTRQLQRTHVTLQDEVARLQAELAEANAQLRRSRALAALGEMAAGIAHEIRNPLGAIRLNAQMLADDLRDVPEQSQLCTRIGSAVQSMDAIVRDVLMFAREMRIRPVATTAPELVDRAVVDAEALLASGKIELVREDAAGPCPVEADPGLVAQAVGNLVRNSVEAMHEATDVAPRLVVRTDRRRVRIPGGGRPVRVVISVEDSGPGIPAEVVDRMFNPFFTTRATGTGLGLAIVHRIVDAHGGHVRVHDARLGGAGVELCLPPTAGKPAAEPVSEHV
ncbi:MAG: sensor histidine kinase [Planctomycetota bacterium]|jgi:signal transduction histidine kinase